MKRTASAKSVGRLKGGFNKNVGRYPHFYLCIENGGDDISLHLGKVYVVIKPEAKDRPTDLRVIHEEREDYIYPASWFVSMELPVKARRAIVAASRG